MATGVEPALAPKAAKIFVVHGHDWEARDQLELVLRRLGLEQLDQLYGPKPGAPSTTPTVIVLDNGPIHTSKASLAQLQARSHWLKVEWLPKYAPELNDIEIIWGQMKKGQLAHQTFSSAEDLDGAIHQAVKAMNQRPSRLPLVNLRILA